MENLENILVLVIYFGLQTLPDRVGAIEAEKSSVFVTSGLHIVCLDGKTGQIVWQHALEGSADDIIVYQTKIYAISSVYDIEHNDFIDSAIWCFSKSGEKQWDTHLDERPWVILPTVKQITVGLGRPRMGSASVSKSGKLQYHQPIVESPITAGCMRLEGPLFAHADGHITNNESKLLQLDSAIESIISHIKAHFIVSQTAARQLDITTTVSNYGLCNLTNQICRQLDLLSVNRPHIGLQFQMESLEKFRC